MSDVSKTSDLVAEARRWANGHPNRRVSELIHGLVDALEAAARVPVQGEPNDDREELERILIALHPDASDWELCFAVDAILARATVPDASTEAKQPEGWSNDDANAAFEEADNRFGNWRGGERHEFADGCYNGFKLGAEWQKARETFISYKAIADEARAERDAAHAAIERVRALHSVAYSGNSRSPNAFCATCITSWPCPTVAALDGAPEPEEKP